MRACSRAPLTLDLDTGYKGGGSFTTRRESKTFVHRTRFSEKEISLLLTHAQSCTLAFVMETGNNFREGQIAFINIFTPNYGLKVERF